MENPTASRSSRADVVADAAGSDGRFSVMSSPETGGSDIQPPRRTITEDISSRRQQDSLIGLCAAEHPRSTVVIQDTFGPTVIDDTHPILGGGCGKRGPMDAQGTAEPHGTSYARFVGRIGALAVALGIGAVLGTPVIAAADTGRTRSEDATSDAESTTESTASTPASRGKAASGRTAGAPRVGGRTSPGRSAGSRPPAWENAPRAPAPQWCGRRRHTAILSGLKSIRPPHGRLSRRHQTPSPHPPPTVH